MSTRSAADLFYDQPLCGTGTFSVSALSEEFKLSLSLGEVPDDSKTFERVKEIGTYAEDYLKDNKIATQNAAGQTVIEAAALQKDGNVQITSSRNGSSKISVICAWC